MSKSFFVVDKLKVVAKECIPLVRFNYSNADYLVYYSVSDDEERCDVFASGLLKSEGRYKLIDVSSDVKSVLESLVRDILELPSLYTKDSNITQLFDAFSESREITFLERFPILGDQEGTGNSYLLNAELNYIEYVHYFYSSTLPRFKKQVYIDKPVKKEESEIIPEQTESKNDSVWMIPSSGNGNDALTDVNSPDFNLSLSDTPEQKPEVSNEVMDDVNSKSLPDDGTGYEEVPQDNNFFTSAAPGNYSFISPEVPSTFGDDQNNNANTLNNNFVYQDSQGYYNDAVTGSYNSYSAGNDKNVPVQNNLPLANQNAGYASSKYVIIGTVCLILASLIVAVSIVIVNRL